MGKKLDDSALDGVTGGMILDASEIPGSDPLMPWEVLDDCTGNRRGAFATKEEAIAAAGGHGASSEEVSWDYVKMIRDMHQGGKDGQ